MARVVCNKHKCRYNEESECTAAVLHYVGRLCMTYKPVRMEDVMRPAHGPTCTKCGGKYKPGGGRVLK